MKLRNISSRNLVLKDSNATQYAVNAYSDLTVSDSLWDDNEFRRWVRYRIRDIAVVDTSATIVLSSLIDTGDPSSTALTIRGASGQTSDLTEWQAHDTTILARVTKDGWIGIGVAPLVPLHIFADINASGGQIRIDASASNTSAAISLYPNRSGTLFEASRILATYNGALQGQLAFYTGDGTGSLQQRGVFDETGKLSIQTDLVSRSSLATQVTVGSVSAKAGVAFGLISDTNLYRNAAGVLKTDGTLDAAVGFQVNDIALASTHLSDTANVAHLAGPQTFTGVHSVSGTTPAPTTNTTQIATTAFVQGVLGSAVAASGLLSARPTAITGLNGSWYYATDQVALYLCLAAAWVRVSLAAGSVSINLTASASPGYILLQGQAWPLTTGIYADTYARFGSPGVIPDFRTFVPAGWKSGDANFGTLLATLGESTHALSTAELAVHSHPSGTLAGTIDNPAITTGAVNIYTGGGGIGAFQSANVTISGATATTGSGSAHNNIQLTKVVNFEAKL